MSSKYYDDSGKEVYTGNTVKASDSNTINTAINAGFELVEADFVTVLDDVQFYTDLAQEWAENPEDDSVVAGEFSALHWASKGSASAAAASTSETNAAASESAASTSETNASNSASAASTSADEAAASAALAVNVAASKLIDDGIVDPQWAWSSEKLDAYLQPLLVPTRKTASFSAVKYVMYMVDTSSAEVTATLPVSPSNGDTVYLVDYGGNFGANKMIVGRNGNTVMGLSEDMDVENPNISIALTYVETDTDWRLT